MSSPLLTCPYCKDDYVWEVAIPGLDPCAVICFECETVWRQGEPVRYGHGAYYEQVMAAAGLEPDIEAVQELRMLNDENAV